MSPPRDPPFVANLFTGYLDRRNDLWTAVVFRCAYYQVWQRCPRQLPSFLIEPFLG